jgi:flagellar hook assembly protein FlgD
VDDANVGFNLAKSEKVLVKIYDMNGRVVKSIDLSNLASGYHQIKVDCSTLTRGTYIFNLIAGTNSSSAKFIIN